MGINDPVRVKLSDSELAQRAVSIAQSIEVVRHLREKLARDAKSTKALIDAELDQIQAKARIILEAEEEAKQGDLFVDGTLGTVAGEIAKRCTCEGGVEAEVKATDCPMHGVGAKAPVIHDADCAASPDGETGEQTGGPCDCSVAEQLAQTDAEGFTHSDACATKSSVPGECDCGAEDEAGDDETDVELVEAPQREPMTPATEADIAAAAMGEPVEVGKVETPTSVAEFRKSRGKRASGAGDAA
jgi:hypothetical protein